MTKDEKRRSILATVFLVGASILMVLIGSNIPYTAAVAPAEAGSLQKFVEFCIDAKVWLTDNALLLGIIAGAGYVVLKLSKNKRK